MTLADKVTAVRLFFAPCFFIIYIFHIIMPFWVPEVSPWTVPVLWILFFVTEITDLIDGKIARRRNEVSDFGKLFDPFADTLVWITFFLCFVADRILPVIPFLVILYREFGIIFLRNLMLKKGIAMGARKGGKIKAFGYMFTGVAALLASSVRRMGIEGPYFGAFRTAAWALFIISVLISLISFADYVSVYKRAS
ncbi:MAG: CDP-alcohol phosphatidyltransferase family protein [Spirochaetaceae bacterium]|jgi:CDP-diacylglycerol--glycerol-3-phosphate 3-phosphatidyltransferase|nr:CDP-alcohol phosphatidyltransferase family protein [Spirochaetaceae bacterium]